MNLSHSSWSESVRRLLDQANILFQQDDRTAAAKNMEQASELLFLQAKKESNLDDKRRLVKRATEILETSVRLTDEDSKNSFATTESSMPFASDPERENVLADALKELDAFVGLQSVKAEAASFMAVLKIQKEREQQELKTVSNTLHYVFSGNPGTGKTAVARILAKILYGYGILNTDKMTETDRQGLVSDHIGGTEKLTGKIVVDALDGVLFIDEAYALHKGSEKDFGRDAIDTLLKRMEDYRHRFVVIVAGYPALMDKFIKSNPGLSSRFSRYIYFEDYDADELTQIFLKNCEASDYHLTPAAMEMLRKILDDAIAQKDEHFGNGRYVRNLFEATTKNQHVRLSQLATTTREQLTTIEAEDIPVEKSPEKSEVDVAAIVKNL